MTTRELAQIKYQRQIVDSAANAIVSLRDKLSEEDEDIYGEFLGAFESAVNDANDALVALLRRHATK